MVFVSKKSEGCDLSNSESSIVNNTLVYTLVMLLAGIGIPTMATLNGVLDGRLQSTSLATAMALALASMSSV